MSQCVDHCKPLVACRHTAPADLLQMLEELSHVFGSEMIDINLIDFLVGFAGDERDKQSQRIAITSLRIPRQIALAHQMLEKKAPHPRTEPSCFSHDAPPVGRTAQSATMRHAATPASSSGIP